MSKKTNLIIAISSLIIFIIISIFTLSGKFDSLNIWVTNQVILLESPIATNALIAISNIGDRFVYIPVAVLLLVLPKLRWKIGVPSVAVLISSAVLNFILKLCFAISRPDTHRLIVVSGYSFPSGHAMTGMAFIGICAIILMRHFKSYSVKIIIGSVSALFVLAVGFSRIYLGVHNLNDIMAGYAMGIFICFFALFVLDEIKNKKSLN